MFCTRTARAYSAMQSSSTRVRPLATAIRPIRSACTFFVSSLACTQLSEKIQSLCNVFLVASTLGRRLTKRRKRHNKLTMRFYWIFVSSLAFVKREIDAWQPETSSTNDLENQLETVERSEVISFFYATAIVSLDAGHVIAVVYGRWNAQGNGSRGTVAE